MGPFVIMIEWIGFVVIGAHNHMGATRVEIVNCAIIRNHNYTRV